MSGAERRLLGRPGARSRSVGGFSGRIASSGKGCQAVTASRRSHHLRRRDHASASAAIISGGATMRALPQPSSQEARPCERFRSHHLRRRDHASASAAIISGGATMRALPPPARAGGRPHRSARGARGASTGTGGEAAPDGGQPSGAVAPSVPRVGEGAVFDPDPGFGDLLLPQRPGEEFPRERRQERVGDDVVDHPAA